GQGAPITDLSVGGKGIAEFLDAALVAPGTYLLWGDTTLFDASKVDMLGVKWTPDAGIGSDFERKALKITTTKAPVVQKTLSLSYKPLNADEIPNTAVELKR